MCSGSSCTARLLSNLAGKYSSLIFFYEKNINYGEKSITEGALAFSCTRNLKVLPFKETTAKRYRNDVIRSVRFLLIRADLGMMLVWDYASCHAARSRLVIIITNNVQKLRWPAKSLEFNHIDHMYAT